MGVEFAAERRLLSEDEMAPLISSHYPGLENLTRPELVDLARWLRGAQNRLRDQMQHRRRVHRGKAEARGGAETASDRGMAAKKQVFSRGLKRVNSRLGDLLAREKREAATAGLRAALARKQAAIAQHPGAGDSDAGAMSNKATRKRRPIITGSRVGSTGKANRVAQARRDNRA